MADFATAHQKTMGHEGGSNFNPADKGNVVKGGVVTIPTYKGIAPVYWATWRGLQIITRAISQLVKMPPYGTREHGLWVKHLDRQLAEMPSLQDLVVAFYKVNFWDANRIGEITSQAVAEWLYDHAVNGGGRGVQWLQQAAGVVADGAIGPQSLAAINAADPSALLYRAREIARDYRLAKVAKYPDQKQFLHSWLARDGYSAAEVNDIIATV